MYDTARNRLDTRGLHAAFRLAVQRYCVPVNVVRQALAVAQLELLRGRPTSLGSVLRDRGHIGPTEALDLNRLEATFKRCRYARTFMGLRAVMAPRGN